MCGRSRGGLRNSGVFIGKKVLGGQLGSIPLTGGPVMGATVLGGLLIGKPLIGGQLPSGPSIGPLIHP